MTEARITLIRDRLNQALHPEKLEITDESHLHIGHAGAREGKGHFRVFIVSDLFQGLPSLQRHRLIYKALGDAMSTEIHALSIQALTVEEAEST